MIVPSPIAKSPELIAPTGQRFREAALALGFAAVLALGLAAALGVAAVFLAFDFLGALSAPIASIDFRPTSSAICHSALPRSALFRASFSRSFSALLASCSALRVSLSAAAAPT